MTLFIDLFTYTLKPNVNDIKSANTGFIATC